MSRMQITLEFDQYDPSDDNRPFRLKATGIWLTTSEWREYVFERLEKVAAMMDPGDQMTISIHVEPKEQEG